MLQNTLKDQIRNALETAGYSTSSKNIELIYQLYMSGINGDSIGKVIRENRNLLKR